MSESQREYQRKEAEGVACRGIPKPCPFCGNTPSPTPIYLREDGRFYTYCYTCEHFCAPAETPEMAIAAWNCRAKEA